MIKKMDNMPKPSLICSHVSGNGAKWIKCELNGKNCPFQHWCTNKRVFEQLGTASTCSNFKEK